MASRTKSKKPSPGPSKPLIAPSILSADFARLREEVAAVERAGAEWLHIDVMDGHFVPNLTMGPAVVKSLRAITELPLDCHLMVTEPGKWIEPFAKAGATGITVHVEAAKLPRDLLGAIRARGCKAGLSLNPDTDLRDLEPHLDHVDLVLLMSVFPGFSGQSFIESTWSRLEWLAAKRAERAGTFLIEVDGGVNATNAAELARRGADVLVAGQAVFGAKDRKAALRGLRL